MSGASAKRKGRAFEQYVVRQFKTICPEARRGLSQSRGGGAEEPDIIVPRIHLEVKHRQRFTVSDIQAATRQAERDCARGKLPAIVLRQDYCRGDVAGMRPEGFVALFGEFVMNSRLHIHEKHHRRGTAFNLWDVLKQAEDDCAPGKIAAVGLQQGKGDDLVCMRLVALIELFGELLAANNERQESTLDYPDLQKTKRTGERHTTRFAIR